MIVACFFPAGVSGQITGLDSDLVSQEPQYFDGDGLARRKQPPWISQGTQLKRKAQFVVGTTALFDLFMIKIIESVVIMQTGGVRWQTQETGLLPLGQNASSWQNTSLLIIS